MLPYYWVPVSYMYAVHVPAPPTIAITSPSTGGVGERATCGTSSSANSYSLCCASVQSHRGIATHWETQINAFLDWLAHNGRRGVHGDAAGLEGDAGGFAFIVRLTTSVRGLLRLLHPSVIAAQDLTAGVAGPMQVNGRRTCGVLEYAAVQSGTRNAGGQQRYWFRRVANDFSKENEFTDLCAFKNYCCNAHGLFIKLDVFRPAP